MKVLITSILLIFAFQSWSKCGGRSLKEMTPSKFLIYHTDKMHKTVYSSYPVKFEVDHDELSVSETLFHISHGKKKDKLCSLNLAKDGSKFSLKQKEFLVVKSAEFKDNKFVMNLDHQKLSSIVCNGVTTMQDLKDVMEPYLMFNCKDTMAYQPAAQTRLPASVK